MLMLRSTLTYAYGFTVGILVGALIFAVSYWVSDYNCKRIVQNELSNKIIIPAAAVNRRP